MSAFDPCCRTTMNKGENSRCAEKKKKRVVKIKLMNGKQYSLTWIGIETLSRYERGKITAPWAVSFVADRWRWAYAVTRHLNST